LKEGVQLLKQKSDNLLHFDVIFALNNQIQIQQLKPIHADSIRETVIFCQGASVLAHATADCDFIVRYPISLASFDYELEKNT
jgi:hypothetical protein